MKNKFEFLGHPVLIALALSAWIIGLKLLLVGPIPAWRLWIAGICFGLYISVPAIFQRFSLSTITTV